MPLLGLRPRERLFQGGVPVKRLALAALRALGSWTCLALFAGACGFSAYVAFRSGDWTTGAVGVPVTLYWTWRAQQEWERS